MSSSSSSSPPVLNVGIIGCGEVAQVIHIPTLSFLRSKFRITYLCDVSPGALAHCASGIATGAGSGSSSGNSSSSSPKTTHDAAELCSSPEVDVVLVASSDEYHADHAVTALRHDKHVLVEKPLALTRRDVQAIIDAEDKSKGNVMVGYMRRYAAVFEDAVREIGGMDKVVYARVRDIIGPNPTFVAQSGTFPKKFEDFKPQDAADKTARAEEQVRTALETECGVAVSPDRMMIWRLLSGLGSHDLSAMREALGMPEKVVGSSLSLPVWNVLFKYPQGFTVSYESGLINVPQFDAHIEVYNADKIVRVQYETPFVKGLPVTLHVTESVEGSGGTALKQTIIRKTYEDPYTLEMKAFWDLIVTGIPVKTTARDALFDLDLFRMAVRYDDGQ